jgi:hypothetical protein
MKEKEKAEELFKTFMVYTSDGDLTMSQNKRICKDCCIEVVSMMEELMFDFEDNPIYTKRYWREVKNQLEEL